MIETKFKKSEVGYIPEDWENVEIGYISTLIQTGPFGSQLHQSDYSTIGTPVVMPKDLIDGRISDLSIACVSREHVERLKRHQIKEGDFLFARRGDVGRCALASKKEIGWLCGTGCFRVSIDKKKCDILYLYYQLQRKEIVEWIVSQAIGSTMLNLNTSILSQIPFVKPKQLKEQSHIATVLTEIDDLIATTKKLIEKKKYIRDGAIYELLTGRKRIEGFCSSSNFKQTECGIIPEDWNVSPLYKKCSLKARIGWQGLTTGEYLNLGDYILITGTDFKDGYINWNSCSYVSKWRYDQDTNIQIQKGDVLITKDGTIGKVAFIDFVPYQGTLNSGIFVVRPKDDSILNSEYLSWLFKSIWFKEFIDQLSGGSTINHLFQRDFEKFQIVYPSDIKEQLAIASTLSSMDSEISSINARLIKYQLMKQGMMQQLLTGKIRLI